MHKRGLLRSIGATAGGTAVLALAGCVNEKEEAKSENLSDEEAGPNPGNRTDLENDEGGEDDTATVSWRKESLCTVRTVTNGLALCTEDYLSGLGAEARLFALDIETGERRWTTEESGGMVGFAPLAVEDAIYTGFGSDDVGAGSGRVYAFNPDGTKRWMAETGGVYDRPRVVGDSVYVGCDDGSVRALRTGNGDQQWMADELVSEDQSWPVPTIAAIEDEIYVAAGDLLALDPRTGDVQWRYGDADGDIRDAVVSDGVAFAADSEAVVAAASGDRLWHQRVGGKPSVRAVADDRVVLASENELAALDAETGDVKWTEEIGDEPYAAVAGGVVYSGAEYGRTVSAYGLTDGSERWNESLDGGTVIAIQLAPEPADFAVWVVTTHRLHGVTADGRITESVPLPGVVQSFAIDGTDRVVGGTGDEVYATEID